MKLMALCAALSLALTIFGDKPATNARSSDSRVLELTVSTQEPVAEPLDDEGGCNIRESKKEDKSYWFIKGNCDVTCLNGYKCSSNGKGPGGDEGYCKVKHTWARNADIKGNCPNHTVMCTVTWSNVVCDGGVE